ncbi:MAG TPA: hypothetical protein VL092_06370 [Chitinophagaceae bacterium]|nr:hypothetical protein [Chitinophagaceae bacterium]
MQHAPGARKNAFYSKIVLWLCFAAMAWGNLIFYPRWEKPGSESTIAWDVEGYYWYLPSLFIFKDLQKQEFKDSILNKYKASPANRFIHGFVHEKSGNYVLKYSSGMAVLYSPAFFTGHMAAKALGYDADGFSIPYKLSLQLWGLLFSFIGLFYLRRLLLLYYEDKVTAIVLFLLVLGTNYFNYAAIDVGMSHSWLFTIYVFILLNTHFFYTSGKARYLYRVGFLTGLTVLIRPTEIIAVLIPALWGLESVSSLKQRFSFLAGRWKTVLIAACCAVPPIALQLVYWKYVSGEWFVYSYQEQGFNWIRPHAFVYSWSYRAGWLRYAPMMLLAFVGLLFYWRHGRNKLAVILFFVLNYYIVSAWNVWDYGGFSGRAMIQSYPILVFPIATLIALALRKKWSSFILAPFILLFLYANIWFTYQAHGGGLLDAWGTTPAYYRKIAGRWSVPKEYEKLKDTDELFEGKPKSAHIMYRSQDTRLFCVTKERHSAEAVVLPASLATGQWIRVAADFQCVQKEWDVWQFPELVVKFTKGNEEQKVRFIRVGRFIEEGETKRLYMDMKVPEAAAESIKVSLYNVESDKKMCMRHLEVSTFNE